MTITRKKQGRFYYTILYLVFLLLFSSELYASNPYVTYGSGGVRARAMGGAYTAVSDDPEALFFNPAGLTNIHHPALTGYYKHLAYDWREEQNDNDVSFNKGFARAGGLWSGISYKKIYWGGAYISDAALDNENNILDGKFYQVSAASEISPGLKLGGSVSAISHRFFQESNRTWYRGHALGFNAGLLKDFAPFHAGVVYHSKYKINRTSGIFENILPDRLVFGASYNPGTPGSFTASLDFQIIGHVEHRGESFSNTVGGIYEREYRINMGWEYRFPEWRKMKWSLRQGLYTSSGKLLISEKDNVINKIFLTFGGGVKLYDIIQIDAGYDSNKFITGAKTSTDGRNRGTLMASTSFYIPDGIFKIKKKRKEKKVTGRRRKPVPAKRVIPPVDTHIGAELFEQEKYDEAIPYLKKSAGKNYENTGDAIYLALCYYYRGDDAAASAILKNIVNKDPDMDEAAQLLRQINEEMK